MRFILNTYKAIPVEREKADLSAFRAIKEALQEGSFVCIAPEGTRSGNGILQKAKPGVVLLALANKVPIIPLAHYGGEKIWSNIKHFRRTQFIMKLGKPFYLKNIKKPEKEVREKMLDEIMFQLASLLPEEMRGAYSQIPANKPEYLMFAADEEQTEK